MTKKEKINGFRYRRRISKQIFFSFMFVLIFNVLTSTSTVNAQIQTGEKDKSKFYNVTSEDEIEVPVPYGFCPSNQENERYVNGKIENKTGNIVATLPTTNLTNWAYEDVTINGETNKYWYNATTEECSIETPVFEIGENGGVIDMEWSTSCNCAEKNGYCFQCRIELKSLNTGGALEIKKEVIGVLQGEKLGTILSNLNFEMVKHELNEGSYKLEIIYDGGEVALQKCFVKKCNIVEYSTSGSGIVENVKTKEGGFVIYDTTTEQLNSNSYDYNTKNYNQYVWIPVPEDMMDYLYAISDDKYTVQGMNFPNSGTTLSNLIVSRGRPMICNNYDIQGTYLKRYFRGENRNDTLGIEQEEYKDMMESIRTYGGFYLGRYESGLGNNIGLMAVSKKGIQVNLLRWYVAYRNHKYVQNEETNTSLVWANQWDYVLRWMVVSSEISNYQINVSTSWGNHLDSYFQYRNANGGIATKEIGQGLLLYSGMTDYTSSNNVADFSGNASEWILNGYGDWSRCSRGGFNWLSSYVKSSISYDSGPPTMYSTYGSRISLTV